MPGFNVDAVALISMATLTIMWFGRLEYRVITSEKDRSQLWKKCKDMETKHDSLDEKVVTQLTSIRESLARIEGRLYDPKPRK